MSPQAFCMSYDLPVLQDLTRATHDSEHRNHDKGDDSPFALQVGGAGSLASAIDSGSQMPTLLHVRSSSFSGLSSRRICRYCALEEPTCASITFRQIGILEFGASTSIEGDECPVKRRGFSTRCLLRIVHLLPSDAVG